MTPAWLTIISLFLGAGIGFVGTYMNERAKERQARKYRWDQPLFDLAREFVAQTRLLVHLCTRFDRADDKGAAKKRIDEVHGDVRALTQQLRILASADCFRTARQVLRHAYAVRAVLVDGKPDVRASQSPTQQAPEVRVEEAMAQFLVQLRGQLGVHNPNDVEVDAGIADNPWRSNPQS